MSDWAGYAAVVVLMVIAYRLERIQEHLRAIDAKLESCDDATRPADDDLDLGHG